MGTTTSSNIYNSHYVWTPGQTYETYLDLFNREKSLTTYTTDDKVAFGKYEPSIIENVFRNEFNLQSKGENYIDGKRVNYADPTKCCLINEKYYMENNMIYTCKRESQNYDSNYCNNVLFDHCFNNMSNSEKSEKCKVWLKKQVEIKSDFFDKILNIVKIENLRNHEYTQLFLTFLREFHTSENNYNQLADSILDSYSNQIKYNEYKCAFPSNNIINEETKNDIVRECWYKECAFAPIYKLKTENIYKRKLCNITICDINISQLNISNQDIYISCKNKFTQKNINIVDIALKKDIENIFFVPELHTFIPFFVFFFLLFL